jgi:orotate phosphoribosyltransferase
LDLENDAKSKHVELETGLAMTAKIVENPSFRDLTGLFDDRFEAGRLLADKLQEYEGNLDVIVLAVPAGGVPVGYVIAKELTVQLDLAIVRKIQIPWNPEAGFGAITWDGKIVLICCGTCL